MKAIFNRLKELEIQLSYFMELYKKGKTYTDEEIDRHKYRIRESGMPVGNPPIMPDLNAYSDEEKKSISKKIFSYHMNEGFLRKITEILTPTESIDEDVAFKLDVGMFTIHENVIKHIVKKNKKLFLFENVNLNNRTETNVSAQNLKKVSENMILKKIQEQLKVLKEKFQQINELEDKQKKEEILFEINNYLNAAEEDQQILRKVFHDGYDTTSEDTNLDDDAYSIIRLSLNESKTTREKANKLMDIIAEVFACIQELKKDEFVLFLERNLTIYDLDALKKDTVERMKNSEHKDLNNEDFLEVIKKNVEKYAYNFKGQAILERYLNAHLDFVKLSEILGEGFEGMRDYLINNLDPYFFEYVLNSTKKEVKREDFPLLAIFQIESNIDADLEIESGNDKKKYCRLFSSTSKESRPLYIIKLHEAYGLLNYECLDGRDANSILYNIDLSQINMLDLLL